METGGSERKAGLQETLSQKEREGGRETLTRVQIHIKNNKKKVDLNFPPLPLTPDRRKY